MRSPSSLARARRPLLAATPPQSTTSLTSSRSAAATTFRASAPVTASWKAAQTPARAASVIGPDSATRRAICVFTPEKLISSDFAPALAIGAVSFGRGDVARLAREPVHDRASRIAEAEQLGDLVERLAGGVVARGAELADALRVRRIDPIDGGVAPRSEERHEGEARDLGRCLAAPEEDGEQVANEVVDADERLARRPGEPLRRLHADEQRADETGTVGDGDAIDVGKLRARAVEGSPCDLRRVGHVVARGELRDDAAVWRVHGDLGVHEVREDAPVRLDEGRARLVAGRLDA